MVSVRRRGVVAGVLGVGVALAASGCSWFGSDDTTAVSVFDVEVGDCFTAPEEITTTFTTLNRVECDVPHEQEAYAIARYTDPGTDTTPETFPGEAALKSFADGACASEFADYVGVDYRDSDLFFTYLLPSPRSWEQDDDRSTLCFVITADGAQLSRSVQGTSW